MALSELIDFTTLMKKAGNKAGMNDNDYKFLSTAYGKAKAISAKASKYILQYPVACSSSISDFKTALAIAKQVEFDCARFYILASGLDPVIDSKNKDTIQAHMDRLTLAEEAYTRKTGYHVSIKPATEDDIINAQEALKYYDKPIVLGKESLLGKTIHSIEMVDTDTDSDPGDNDSIIEDNSLDGTETNAPGEDKSARKTLKDALDEASAYDRLNKLGTVETQVSTQMIDKLGKAAPTVINVELILNDIGGQRTVRIPLAFKSDLQFVSSNDIKDLLKSVDTPGKKLQNFIKITSGEMNFFKDWLFALDDAKKDTEKERLIGRVPIFRQLMDAKNRYRVKSIVEAIPLMSTRMKNFIINKKTQKDLPMCTVVVTEQDFESGTGITLNRALNGTSRIVNQILDTYMLLGFGIVDELNDVAYFFYSGEDGYSTVRLSEMGANSSNDKMSDKLTDVLASMSRMITKR